MVTRATNSNYKKKHNVKLTAVEMKQELFIFSTKKKMKNA